MRYPAAQEEAANAALDHSRPDARLRPEESLPVAALLSIAGGYLDAFTWIVHDGVMANAQTANVVLLAVHATMGEGWHALRFVPSIAAFMLGVFIVCRLRAGACERSRRQLALLTLVIEIGMLAVVMMLHVRLPSVAGTVGISFAAAMQTASFAKVEGRNYSSVMVTGNIRYAVETLFAGWFEKHDPAALRQSRILMTVCLTFAAGAALGAVLTTSLGNRALVVPIMLLLAALVLCRRA